MGRYTLLILNGAILTGCAVFIYPARMTVLTALLLLLPFLDHAWNIPVITPRKKQLLFVFSMLCLFVLIISLHPNLVYTAITTLFLVALPEEWFFRAYFMTRCESFFSGKIMRPTQAAWLANISTSLFFAITHIPTQGLFGLSVFLPSLLFGWTYQKYRSLLLVILLHAVSNIFFVLYLKKLL